MLSLLAKIQSAVNGNNPSPQLDSMMMMEEDVNLKDSLIQLSGEVDRQLIKLKALLNGSTAESPEDRAVVISATREYGGELGQLDSMVVELEGMMGQSARQTDDLVVMISRLTRLQQPTTPMADVSMDSARRLSRFATPLRADQSTPKSNGKSRIVDFDAFPHTPTLEQLGLSRATLDVVGERRRTLKGATSTGSDYDSDISLRHSLGSHNTSLATPRLTKLRSSSSFGSNPPNLATRLTDLSGVTSRQKTFNPEMTSTPTVANSMSNNSPFGGASSTIFGGRPSDAFSGYGSEF